MALGCSLMRQRLNAEFVRSRAPEESNAPEDHGLSRVTRARALSEARLDAPVPSSVACLQKGSWLRFVVVICGVLRSMG